MENSCLLDELGQRLGCLYLSSLKKSGLRMGLLRELHTIPADYYPCAQWADALSYLTTERPSTDASAKDLRARLLTFLERDRDLVHF